MPTDFDLTQKVRRSNAILPNVYAGFAQFSQLQLTSIGLGNEQKGDSPQGVIARRSAYHPTERRCLTAGAESDGSRRVFHAVPHDWHHLNKSRKRECGQQKPETSLYLASIVRGVPREKARREPVGSAPPTPRCCLPAASPLPPRCLLVAPLPRCFSCCFTTAYLSSSSSTTTSPSHIIGLYRAAKIRYNIRRPK